MYLSLISFVAGLISSETSLWRVFDSRWEEKMLQNSNQFILIKIVNSCKMKHQHDLYIFSQTSGPSCVSPMMRGCTFITSSTGFLVPFQLPRQVLRDNMSQSVLVLRYTHPGICTKSWLFPKTLAANFRFGWSYKI